MKKCKVGIIGCGMISDAYFNAAKRFRNIEVVACADLISARAAEKAQQHNVRNLSCEALLADPEIELVINLTVPQAHGQVAKAALLAGKHTYSEKPFGVDLEEAKSVMELAKSKNLQVGCAPDTFLGCGQQTARKLVDDGWIGKVLSGTAIVQGRGPEKWGHAPFFYDKGAGPMLDLGPYYVTGLVNLLGPAVSVTAVTACAEKFRTFGAEVAENYQDKYKPYDAYPVNVNAHQTGVIEFANGAVITLIASFEVYKHTHAPIELYGSEGSLLVPDPNTFGGPVRLFRREWPYRDPAERDFQEMPMPFSYANNSRSIGAADMAMAIANKRPHRANGDLALHVLEIMLAFDKSSAEGGKVNLTTTCQRPKALPLGLSDGEIDA